MEFTNLLSEMERSRKLNKVTSLPFIVNNMICWFNYKTKSNEATDTIKIILNDIYLFDGIKTTRLICSQEFDYKIVDAFIGDDEEYYDYFEEELSDNAQITSINQQEMWNRINKVLPKNFIEIYQEIVKHIEVQLLCQFIV